MAERRIESPEKFFDILNEMGDGQYVTIGYVMGANLKLPVIKRKNPETNRMKGYPVYTVFKEWTNRDKKLVEENKLRKIVKETVKNVLIENFFRKK